MSRYLIGIDLGTTNTVVYYKDKSSDQVKPKVFNILQATAIGEIEKCESLPSFLYMVNEKEQANKSLQLPWDKDAGFSIGKLAQKNASSLPGQVVSSAKSWLCAENVDRLSPILPRNCTQENKQISPLKATRLILEHIKNAWNSSIGKDGDKIEEQTILLTVPASFDAIARELTVTAAQEAGLKTILLEEPQAAFYSWLLEASENWRENIAAGESIIVCDIGGGTTDFSLIKVIDKEGDLGLERIAVGKHTLLGGDNMDLTLAYMAGAKLKAEKKITLDNYQISGLRHACRQAKEVLLSNPEAPPQKLTILGRGSKLIGGTITTELTRDEITKTLIEGFFPSCNLNDKSLDIKKSGLRSFDLNYESDPAITRHMAQFLSRHCATQEDLPSCILFNGGATKSELIRERIISTLKTWHSDPDEDITILSGVNPDHSVAMGASYYGEVREGKGIRIKAGSSHTYYLGVETSMPAIPGFAPPIQALCVLPFGTEEGTGLNIDFTGLGLLVGETTEFRFFSSTSRKEDSQGSLVDDAESHEDMIELSSLAATLPVSDDIPTGTLVPVTLQSEFTETGTLQIWCIGEKAEQKWKLDFELRCGD